MHRAVPAPEDHLRVAQLLRGQAAARLVRVVEHAVVEVEAHLQHGGVAAQVLVGQEEHLLAALERPVQRPLGVGRGADHAAVAADEALDVGGGVHVRHRHGRSAMPSVLQDLPGRLDLAEHRHVGHRAAGGQVGQDDLLRVAGEDVGALGHEVHAAEDDELGVRPGRGLAGELERVAGHVGELDHLVALVVVAEHEHAVAERGLGGAGAGDQVGSLGAGSSPGQSTPRSDAGVAAAAEQQQRGGGVDDGSAKVVTLSWSHAGAGTSRDCDLEDSSAVRVLICPDKFAGTLSAVDVAAAVADGWRAAAPATRCAAGRWPTAGPGFVEVLPRRSAATG